MVGDTMMRAGRSLLLSLAASGVLASAAPDFASAASTASVRTAAPTDISSQSRRRPRVRIFRSVDERGVYPRYFPGANAVRDCSVSYVQEFRPSGTVIAPHMRCFWRQP
jgi:hypothetical protein